MSKRCQPDAFEGYCQEHHIPVEKCWENAARTIPEGEELDTPYKVAYTILRPYDVKMQVVDDNKALVEAYARRQVVAALEALKEYKIDLATSAYSYPDRNTLLNPTEAVPIQAIDNYLKHIPSADNPADINKFVDKNFDKLLWKDATQPADTPQQGDELQTIVGFLCGENELDGYWYGEHPKDRPVFWWRKKLKAAVAAERRATALRCREAIDALPERGFGMPEQGTPDFEKGIYTKHISAQASYAALTDIVEEA
jgi:hypothetical protein